MKIDEVNHCHAEVISVQPFKQTRCTMPLRSAAGPLRCAIHRLNLGWNFMKFLQKSLTFLTTIKLQTLWLINVRPCLGRASSDDPLPKQQKITKGSFWPSNSYETTKRLRKHLQTCGLSYQARRCNLLRESIVYRQSTLSLLLQIQTFCQSYRRALMRCKTVTKGRSTAVQWKNDEKLNSCEVLFIQIIRLNMS